MKIFSERLRESLGLKSISQSELAKRVGVARNTITGYCNGKHEPSLEILAKICKAINETSDYLIGLVD